MQVGPRRFISGLHYLLSKLLALFGNGWLEGDFHSGRVLEGHQGGRGEAVVQVGGRRAVERKAVERPSLSSIPP